MGSSLSFFAGETDDVQLLAFIREQGLHLVPPKVAYSGTFPPVDAAAYPFCYISLSEHSKLTPCGKGKDTISNAIDPLVELLRSYKKGETLVAGRIFWSDDVKDLATKSKPVYGAVTKWMKKNWKLRDSDGYYIGPRAAAFAESGGSLSYVPSGVTVQHR